MGPDFFQTQMGHRFYESTMPSLVKAIEENTKALTGLVAATKKATGDMTKAGETLKQVKTNLRNMLKEKGGTDGNLLMPTEEKLVEALNLDPDVIAMDVEERDNHVGP